MRKPVSFSVVWYLNSPDLFTERCCQGDESPTSFSSQKHPRMISSHIRLVDYAVSLCFLVISYSCVISYNMGSMNILQVSRQF